MFPTSGPPGMGGMNPRMNPPPRGPGMGPMGSYGPGMRGGPPNSNLGPSGGPIPPMIGGQRPWTPNTSTPMNYSSSSPGSYGASDALGARLRTNLNLECLSLVGSTSRRSTRHPDHAIATRLLKFGRREHVHHNEARRSRRQHRR